MLVFMLMNQSETKCLRQTEQNKYIIEVTTYWVYYVSWKPKWDCLPKSWMQILSQDRRESYYKARKV